MLKSSRETAVPLTVIIFAASGASWSFIGLCSPEVCLTVARFDARGQTRFDAGPCTIGMLGPGGAIVDVAGHINHLAGDGNLFTRGRLVFLALVSENTCRCQGGCNGQQSEDVQLKLTGDELASSYHHGTFSAILATERGRL